MPPFIAEPSDFSKMLARPPAWLPGPTTPLNWPLWPRVYSSHQAQPVQQLLADFGRDRAARQHVFDAVDLRRLRQDGGAAVAHQDVHRRAERRVGRDAGEAVGAAALQPDLDVAGAAPAVRLYALARGSISSIARMPASIVSRVPPTSCITIVRSRRPRSRPCESTRSATWLRSQPRPDDQHARQVGVARVAGQRAAQQVEVRAGRRHAAAGGLRERDHAVDVGEVAQPLRREVRGDAA